MALIPIGILLGIVGVAVLSRVLRKRNSNMLAEQSDDQFLREYYEGHHGAADLILKEREHIAALLSIPRERLSAKHRFDELRRLTGFVGEYEFGMSQLGDELFELHKDHDRQPPDRFPETVGELIQQTVMIRDSDAKH